MVALLRPEGRFRAPLRLGAHPTTLADAVDGGVGVNALAQHATHGLLGAACDDGVVRLWDARA